MIKYFCTFLIAVTLAAFCTPTMSVNAEEDSYTYTIINEEVTIVGFTGSPEYINIPETLEGFPVTGIRDNAFYKCGSLREIVIPQSVETIGHHAFYACSSLTAVTLPQSLAELGMGCFCGCSSLTSVSLPESLTVLPDSCFRACISLTEIIIPQSITKIDKFCFSGCTALSFVSLGGNTKEIGSGAFFMCNSLESLYIPPTVTVIDTDAVGYIPTDDGVSSKEDFLILGSKGSAAETYADENSMTFMHSDETAQVLADGSSFFTAPKSAVRFIIFGLIIFAVTLALVVKQIIRESKS